MSVEMESLSSILGDSPFSKGEPAKPEPAPPAVEPKVEAPVEVAETEAPKVEPVRDEAGRFAPKVEPKAELQRADVAAIIDERRRRQHAERELAQLKGVQPKPDFWEDPQKAVVAQVQEFISPLESKLLDLQVENARLRHSDFDECMMAFLEAAQKDEHLRYQADNSLDQLQFIYREGKRIKELGPYGGDLSKRDEARFGELKGEIGKRDEQIKALQAQIDALTKSQAELAAVPRSLNQMTSGAPPKVADVDPEDIREIVRFKSG